MDGVESLRKRDVVFTKVDLKFVRELRELDEARIEMSYLERR